MSREVQPALSASQIPDLLAMVERVAASIAGSTWGVLHWYRGTAIKAIATVYELDADEVSREFYRLQIEAERCDLCERASCDGGCVA